MELKQINLNLFRVFLVVYQKRSMSVAAESLHLTQSGVSQHIKNLEQEIGVKLFDRNRSALVPTAAARTLFGEIEHGLTSLEQALSTIDTEKNSVRGNLTLSAPVEFGTSILCPLLGKFMIENPAVNVKLQLGIGESFINELLLGEIDFAFVDAFRVDRRIKITPLVQEHLALVCTQNYFEKHSKKDLLKPSFFEKLDYIDYDPSAEVTRFWLSKHFPKKPWHLKPRAVVQDVQGVARLIATGLGCGVLPDYVARHLEGQLKINLHYFKGRNVVVRNSIGLASVTGKTWNKASVALRDYLTKHLN